MCYLPEALRAGWQLHAAHWGTSLPPFAPTLPAEKERALGDGGILTTASDKPPDGLIWATSGYKWASRNGWHKFSEWNFIAGPAYAWCQGLLR